MGDERRVLAYASKSGSRIICRAVRDGLMIAFPRRNAFEAIGDAVNAVGGEGLILLAIVPMLLAYSLHSVWRSGWSAAVLSMLTVGVVGVAVAVGGVCRAADVASVRAERGKLYIRLKDGTHLWDGAQDADWSWDDGYDAEDMSGLRLGCGRRCD